MITIGQNKMEEKNQKYLEEMKDLKRDPHSYIMNWMDKNLLFVGKEVFKLLALQPCSHILPDIRFETTNVRSSFNVLFLAPPSSGKSTICKKYAKICYSPYPIRKVSSTGLVDDLSSMDMFTLILEDFSQIGNDYEVVKVIEGALGDERSIMKKTRNEDVNETTQGVGLMCGTWTDLARYLEYFKGGLLFRFVLLFMDLSQEQKLKIGQYINNGIGNRESAKNSEFNEQAVIDYYRELLTIQADEHKEIKPITEYHFTNEIKDEIYKAWEAAISKVGKGIEFEFNRELHEAYRFLISSAFLNVFNRKVENGVLHPNRQDLDLAKSLMISNLKNKLSILQSKSFFNSSASVKDLRAALANDKISQTTKKVLLNLAPKSFISKINN